MVTTPDQPKGRGLRVQPNPVKAHSSRLGMVTLTPMKLKDPELEKKIRSLRPDLFVVASYGKLIPDSWLKIPTCAALNIHPSLLPKHRGAAPIPWQILEGDKETGVSIAEVTPKLDAGDLFCQLRIPLGKEETSESLTRRLAELSQRALQGTLLQAEQNQLKRTPQNEREATYARKLTKEDSALNLADPAIKLERKIRAFHPWPGAHIDYKGKWLRILAAAYDSAEDTKAPSGILLEVNLQGYLRVQTGKGSLKLLKVQLPGGRPMAGNEFVNGQRLQAGFSFLKSS